MDSWSQDIILTEDNRLCIQQSYARSLRLLRKQENQLQLQNKQLQEDNAMLEKELATNRTNQLNEIYFLQCNLEKYENLLRVKDHNTEILLKEVTALEKDLFSQKDSTLISSDMRPLLRRRSHYHGSKFDCSTFLYLPLHLYPDITLSSLAEYSHLIDSILLKSPCMTLCKGSFSVTETDLAKLNPHSYPILHRDIESLPFCSLEWDSSLMSYEQFHEQVVQELSKAISQQIQNEATHPVPQLVSYSRSALESLFDHEACIPNSLMNSQLQMRNLLLDNGIQSSMISYWKTDPSLGPHRLFKLFEYRNRPDSLLKALELNALETLRHQFNETPFALEAPPRVISSSTSPPATEDLSPTESASQFASLQSLIQELELKKTTLLEENRSLQSELKSQKDDNATLRREFEKVVSESTIKADHPDVEGKLKALEVELSRKEDEIASISQQLHQSKDSVSKLEADLLLFERRCQQSTAENAELKQKWDDMEARMKKELNECGVNTEELSPSIAADQQENEKENRIHSLENDLLLERQIFERNKEEFQQKILDLEGTNSRKSDQIAELQSTQLLLQNQLRNKEQEMKNLMLRLSEKDSFLQEKDTLISSLRSTDEKRIIDDYSHQIKRLSAEILSIQKDLQLLTSRNNSLEVEHRRQIDASIHLNQTIKSLNSLITNKEIEICESKEVYSRLEEKYQELSIRYTSSQAENESLRQALRKVNDEIHKLLKENNKYEYTTAELMKVTQAQEINLTETRNQLTTNTSLLTKKDHEIQALKVENEKLIQQLNQTLNERLNEIPPSSSLQPSQSPPSPTVIDTISPPGKSKNKEINESLSRDISPVSSSFRSSQSRVKSSTGLMSRSVPLPSIETADDSDSVPSTKKDSPIRRQVYYKGVPIEQSAVRDGLNELQIIEPKPKKSSVAASSLSSSSSSQVRVYPTDGVVQGLEGMKHIRNINSQEYRRHTEQYLQSSSTNPILTPLAKNSSSSGTFEGLLIAPGAEPTKKRSERLPSITLDGNSSGAIHFQNPDRKHEEHHDKLLVPKQSGNSRSNDPKTKGSTSRSPEGRHRKSIQHREEEIQKILEKSSQRRNQSHSLPSSAEEDKEVHQKHSFKLKPSSSSPSPSLSFDDDISMISSASAATAATRPSRSKGGNSAPHKDSASKPHPQKTRQDRIDEPSSPSSSAKKKKISSSDSHLHKVPCAICGLHFSGDGLKLPHSHHNSLLGINDNSSQSSQDHTNEVLFCSFDCARLWGKTKPYHRHTSTSVHHSPSS